MTKEKGWVRAIWNGPFYIGSLSRPVSVGDVFLKTLETLWRAVLSIAVFMVVVGLGIAVWLRVVEPALPPMKNVHANAVQPNVKASSAPLASNLTSASPIRSSGEAIHVSESSLWVGRYTGGFEGGTDGDLNIVAANNARLSMSLSMGAERCVGEITGTAKVREHSITIFKPKDESGRQCRVNFYRRGDRIDVSEKNCGYFHGFECSFNGQVRRR